MGFLDGVIGGLVGGEMAATVNGIIARHGGLSGVVEQFKSQGLGNTVKSWISTGENMPITPDQVQSALGPDLVAKLAAKAGMTPEEMSAKLATVLPTVIDKMTPHGVIPPEPGAAPTAV